MSIPPAAVQAEIDALIAAVTEGLKPSLYLKMTPEQIPKSAAQVVRALIWKRDEFRRLRAEDATPCLNTILPER